MNKLCDDPRFSLNLANSLRKSASMDFDKKLEQLRKDIKSERLSMSIGELVSLYERDELDIHPKFQRVIRWEPMQKSRLIESLILRIPIPPIFVAQDTEGRWDVVDGVQRLGTIFEFMGVLRDANGTKLTPLVLEGTHLLPELKGLSFSAGSKKVPAFSPALQLDVRRARLDLEILLRESDASAKYELFERLNTGGSIASDQEVRNCVLVWVNEGLFDWLQKDICERKSFQQSIELTERAEERQYRMELALRFFAFYKMPEEHLKEISDIGDFLNKKNREIAESKTFDTKLEGGVFADTFDLLNDALGSSVFKKYDASTHRSTGPFLISAFEAVALGVAANIDKWRKAKGPQKKLVSLVTDLWTKPAFTGHIGIGVPARDRIRWSVPFGRKHFLP